MPILYPPLCRCTRALCAVGRAVLADGVVIARSDAHHPAARPEHLRLELDLGLRLGLLRLRPGHRVLRDLLAMLLQRLGRVRNRLLHHRLAGFHGFGGGRLRALRDLFARRAEPFAFDIADRHEKSAEEADGERRQGEPERVLDRHRDGIAGFFARGLPGGTALFGFGAFGAVTAALIAALALALPTWAAALIIAIVYGIVAYVLVQNGKKKLREAEPPLLPQTTQTLKDDITWAKTQPKSGVK